MPGPWIRRTTLWGPASRCPEKTSSSNYNPGQRCSPAWKWQRYRKGLDLLQQGGVRGSDRRADPGRRRRHRTKGAESAHRSRACHLFILFYLKKRNKYFLPSGFCIGNTLSTKLQSRVAHPPPSPPRDLGLSSRRPRSRGTRGVDADSPQHQAEADQSENCRSLGIS